MQRIGIYGGTFDPPHIGHVQAAAQAVDALHLDRLLLIPAYATPKKSPGIPGAEPEHRLAMLRLAAEAMPKAEINTLEMDRGEISYTFEAVKALRKIYPEDELYLLLGSDVFFGFMNWKQWEEICKDATIAVLYRGEKGERQKVQEQLLRMQALGVNVVLVENDAVFISSTQMRRMLAFRCAGDLLPEGVLEYIREYYLYNTRAPWKQLPMEQLEQVVVSLLKPNRVAHVLGCRDTAVELAKRWGADETDAARAGILHDITKAIDGPLQLTLCDAYGKILSDFSRKYPKTLHALTGSLVAERIFGENKAVVSAIEHHTTGKADMTLLEKIIYVADYMEPNRDFPGVEQLRELAFSDIDAALKLGLEMTLQHLAKQGAEVSPESREALAWLNRPKQ